MKRVQTTEIEAKCLALSLSKLLKDYSELGFFASEGPEWFFEEWALANFTVRNEIFESKLLEMFIKRLFKRMQ